MKPLPVETFETGRWFTPRVDRFSQITVRTNRYSVPTRFIGRQVRVLLHASALVVFDGRTEIAQHERLLTKSGSRLELDHCLEALLRKPGALPGATVLEQAGAAGKFTPIHEDWWTAACNAHGDTAGTRALIEGLLLNRHMQHDHVVAGLAAALQVGALTADAAALEARRIADNDEPTSAKPRRRATTEADRAVAATVTSLTQRRLAQLPKDTRRMPDVSIYDQLLPIRRGRRWARAGPETYPEAEQEEAAAMSPRRRMSEQAAEAAVDQACRVLRLPTIRNQCPDLAAKAGNDQMSYLVFLAELLLAECDGRARRRSERRIKAAQFPREKSLREFDFDANPNIDSAVVGSLTTCEWVKKGLPLCLIGDSGTGKSHLLIALGTEAAMAGFRVKYTLASKLANELVEAADEKILTKTIARYGRVDLLRIDELGYMQLDRRGAELLFQVLTEREGLAVLLMEANHVVTVETLVHRLWGDSPPGRARNTLQNYVLRLRRALGCPVGGAPVLTRPHGYVIETVPDALDLHRFTALVRQGRTALADELGVAPGAGLRQVHRRLLTATPDLIEARAVRAALPSRDVDMPVEMTSFVGRETQVAEARRLLGTARLVTLTGVGGVGKTRLALRVAAEVAPSFADGVRLADLAPLSDADLLDRTVSEALGLRDQSARPAVDAMVSHLRDRSLLLVLDNCEHMVEHVAGLVLRLARAAPGLRVLATSRQRLRTPGEHVLTVPALSLPAAKGQARGATVRPEAGTEGAVAGAADAAAEADDPLLRSEAVRLLLDRAAGSAPAFRLTARNREAVAQLCLRLDGIPLAIELAAVRLSAMTAEEILERLDDRFRLLSLPRPQTPARHHHTLRGIVDWSYDLCTGGERLLWNRLSVFSGGFDLEAAETVCAGEGVAREDVLDLLAGLVDKSIVVVNSSGDRARYGLLETIRQYGRQRLQEEDGTTRLRVRHSEYYRLTTVRAGRSWCGPREVDWLVRLRTELPNLRTALDYCASRDDLAKAGLEIAVNLARTRCWFFSSTLGEGRHWLERLLATGPERSPAQDVPDPSAETDPGASTLIVGALAMKAWIALCQGDNPAAETFLAECRASAQELPDVASVAPVTYIEGAHAMLVRGDQASRELLAEARDRFRTGGQAGDAHMATMLWAMAEAFFGTRASASAARDVYVAEAEASGAEWARTWALWCTGLVELRHGEAERALAPLQEALAQQQAIGDSWGPVWGLEALAWAVAATGDCTRAAWLLGAAHRMRRDTGVALTGLRPFHEAHRTAEGRVRGSLGSAEYTAAWSRGALAEDALRQAWTCAPRESSAGPAGSDGPRRMRTAGGPLHRSES
nr:ATP-binding protein [Streptomyces tibetensis]